MLRKIKVSELYHHFKGHDYKVIALAKHSETLEDLVIYQNIHTKDIWARPISLFNSLVDKEKYPDITQKYRFEKIIKK